METNRLEAFSDGVLAIIITIMVLELKVPHGASLADLLPLLPVFLSYVLSYLYLGIYWNNHHHLLKACRRVTAGILWANLHLLFWLSLFPFVTGWMGENHGQAMPTALYGAVLWMAAVAYFLLQGRILAGHAPDSKLARALGSDLKSKASLGLYALALGSALAWPLLSHVCYVAVALLWLVPDRRIERALGSE
jgi:uncharacterized membrane protein